MLHGMWLPLIALSLSPAHGITQVQGGPILELGAGLDMGGSPVQARGGAHLSALWWTGTYDDAYAFGRHWAVGPTLRVDVHPDALGLAPMLEVRRGLDIFIAGLHAFVAGGAVSAVPLGSDVAPPLGWTGRGGFGAKLRRHRYWGATLRLEAGVDGVGDQISFAGGVMLGVGFSRPARQMIAL